MSREQALTTLSTNCGWHFLLGIAWVLVLAFAALFFVADLVGWPFLSFLPMFGFAGFWLMSSPFLFSRVVYQGISFDVVRIYRCSLWLAIHSSQCLSPFFMLPTTGQHGCAQAVHAAEGGLVPLIPVHGGFQVPSVSLRDGGDMSAGDSLCVPRLDPGKCIPWALVNEPIRLM